MFSFSDAKEKSVGEVVTSDFSSLQCFCLISGGLALCLFTKLRNDLY